MYRLDITPAAIQDETDALRYIAEVLQNPSAASSLADQIEKCYSTLEDNPFLYGLCTDSNLSALGYHKAVIKKYVLIYKIEPEKSIVHILRFVYGPSDYVKKL